MRRADRLFKIIQSLRREHVVTAARIAAELGVSERTVYRDIHDLDSSGVPIKSAAGVGYALGRGYDLPPLMFTADELQALVLGVRMVKAWSDADLARAATDAAAKIEAVLPKSLRHRLGDTPLFAPEFHIPKDRNALLGVVRSAIAAHNALAFEYTRADGNKTERRARPLGLFFWGDIWTLVAWCELRHDFRSFRLDRIKHLRADRSPFEAEPGQTLEDFFRYVARVSKRKRGARSE